MGGDVIVALARKQTHSEGLVEGIAIEGSAPALSGTVIRFTDPECRR